MKNPGYEKYPSKIPFPPPAASSRHLLFNVDVPDELKELLVAKRLVALPAARGTKTLSLAKETGFLMN